MRVCACVRACVRVYYIYIHIYIYIYTYIYIYLYIYIYIYNTHARTHARTHAHTHTSQSILYYGIFMQTALGHSFGGGLLDSEKWAPTSFGQNSIPAINISTNRDAQPHDIYDTV